MRHYLQRSTPSSQLVADLAPSSAPVFLHGLWRSGTTYIWSRFRANPATYCYYEPLHHGLDRLTVARIHRDGPNQVADNGHPKLERPYFAEFAPLIRRSRGVGDFHRSLAHHRFALEPDEPHARLERYLGTLLGHPAAKGYRVVLGFNRSSFRMGWMRRRFPGYHIHIDREPREIWASYVRYLRNGNHFFFTSWLMLLELNAAHPLFARLAERLPLRRTWRDRLVKPRTFYRQALAVMALETSYLLVFHIWRVCALHALSQCDQVFDYARTSERGYARRFCEEVRTRCALELDLDGLRPNRPGGLAICNQAEVEREAMSLLPKLELGPFLDAGRARSRLHELAPRKAALLQASL